MADDPPMVPPVVAVELMRHTKDTEAVAREVKDLKQTVERNQADNIDRQTEARSESRERDEQIHSRITDVRKDMQEGFKEARASARNFVIGVGVPIILLLAAILFKGG